ncbi:MAG: hypothetical protein H8E44_36430 [Planctomycetes bacterium]|nr:hypothetical protein [Planctomycetota bacterium]
MAIQVIGTVEGDVIRLDRPLGFPDASRVELTVKPLDANGKTWDDFMDELELLCEEEPIGSGGVRYMRDDLYEGR